MMDQKEAQRLYEAGGIFIFLEVPEGTEFGIDLKSWNTGEKFRGVKMIPPGVHYIFYSSVSKTGDTAPRIGFFHNFKKSEVLVKKWNKIDEMMSTETVSGEEVARLTENLRALDSFLGPYPYDILDKWVKLSSHITESLVEKLTPLSGQIRSALELESCTDADRPRGQNLKKNEEPSTSNPEQTGETSPKRRKHFRQSEDDLLPNLKAREGTELRMTEFPEKPYPEGSTPADITKHSLDSTYLLDKILSSYAQQTDILGELEFSFICFLVGHSLEAFEQWKKIFSLLCSCKLGIKKYRRLYDDFLSIVEVQGKEVPAELIADIVSNSNFVYVKLRDLFSAVWNSDVDGEIKCKAERLRKTFSDTFGWDFSHLDSDLEDEAPVVVELE